MKPQRAKRFLAFFREKVKETLGEKNGPEKLVFLLRHTMETRELPFECMKVCAEESGEPLGVDGVWPRVRGEIWLDNVLASRATK